MANNVTVFVNPVLLSLMSVYVYHVYPVPRSLRSLDISWEVGTGSLGSSALPITALYRGRGQQQYLCRCLWITMFTN